MILPISFSYRRLPVTWEIERPGVLRVKLRLDRPPWTETVDTSDCRSEFFRLPETEKALVGFLVNYGPWDVTTRTDQQGRKYGMVKRVETAGVWEFRRRLRTALLRRRPVEGEEFHLPVRKIELPPGMDYYHGDSVPVAFDFPDKKGPRAVVRLLSLRELLMATVYADLARGIRFRLCSRRDCRAPFPLLTKHRKLYCTPACAHLAAVRADLKRKKRLS